MRRFLILASLLPCFVGAFAQTTLKSGSIVTLRFTEELKSDCNCNTANVIVANDVKVGDKTIISAGTPILTQVTATKRRGCGRAGNLNVGFNSTRATDGSFVNLMGGNISRVGKNKKGMAIGLGVGLGIWAWPFLACLAVKGGNAVIPEGTLTQNVMTANEVTIK